MFADSGPKRGGVTLVEVVASIAILSTLLTSILFAYGQHIRQLKKADQILTAVQLADDFLTDGVITKTIGELEPAGVFQADTDFVWRIQSKPAVVSNAAMASDHHTLQVFHRSAMVGGTVAIEPLVEIEFLMPPDRQVRQR